LILYFIQGITLGFAAAVQPGPFQTYLISQTVSHGWRRTLPAVLAPLLSDGPIILLVLLALVRLPNTVLQLLRLGGGAFLIYLAFEAFKTWKRFETSAPASQPPSKSLLQAAFVNLLNPNPYLFWSLVGGPLLLASWRETPLHSLAFLGGFYLILIGSMAAWVIIFGTTGRLGPRVSRALLGLSALALIGLGIYQTLLGLLGLLK
jgi:threonine/homoserine/homoserine lactone efflux protein